MLAATGLSFRAGKKTLVRDAHLAVEPGIATVLLGPNGAGKSTLLRMMAGEIPPSDGAVELDGVPLARHRPDLLARRRAVLPQSSALSFAFTVAEVVAMGRTPHASRTSAAENRSIAVEAMSRAGVSRFAHRTYTTLSGGERQRVHLARVLAQVWRDPGAPRYLLLDEPVGALDPRFQHEMLDLVRSLAQEGFGVLAILHDLNLAAHYADRVALMHDGAIAACGSPAGILTPGNIHGVYGLCTTVCEHPSLGCPLVIHHGTRAGGALPEFTNETGREPLRHTLLKGSTA